MLKVKLLALVWCLLLLGSKPADTLREHPKIRNLHEAASRYRAQSGLPAQELDEELCRIAQRWANHMAAHGAMFHGGGEQIIGQGYPDEESCIRGWINSPGHRVWVLGRQGTCGFGCQRGANGQMFWAGVYR